MGETNRAHPVSARSAILAAIRQANPGVNDDVNRDVNRGDAVATLATVVASSGLVDPDTDVLAQFLAVLGTVGGQGVVRDDATSLDHVMAEIAAGLDVGDGAVILVVPGRIAVAENGAVYVDATDLATRADLVLAEHLVLVVSPRALVRTMHEAVRLMPVGSACGWFLSGPSKTADIEQSLVIGAQGARTLHVVFDGTASLD